MGKITAFGELYGNELEVEVEWLGDHWQVSDPMSQRRFDTLLNEGKPIGGVYYPPIDSLLTVHNIMQNHFFDRLIRIKHEGELEKIPYEPNLIY